MYTDVHIYRYVYIYTYIQICTNVNIYVCMYVCIQAAAARCGGDMYACMYVFRRRRAVAERCNYSSTAKALVASRTWVLSNVNIYVCMYVCIQAAAARCGGAVRSTALQLQQYGEGSCGVTNLGAVTNLGTGVTSLGAGGSLPLHLLCQVKRTRFLYILLREYIYVPYYRIGYLTKRTRLYALL